MEQDQQNKKSRIALCTEFGGGQWRMLFLDTLEECRVRFPGAKQGKWFEQSEDGKWQQVEPKGFADFDVRMDELDEWCCLKIRMPVCFESDTFISSINERITGSVHVNIGDRKRQTVHYWAYVSLTSFNAPIDKDDGSSNLQWSIRSEADILGPYEQSDQQQQEVVEEREAAVEDLHKSSPENMKIVPYQPNWIGIGQEQQANQHQMVENAAPRNDQQNIDDSSKIKKSKTRSKTPGALEKIQQEALVLCWKRLPEDTFLYEWDPAIEQFNRRLQASNKRLNDANVSIRLGGWYQIHFVKYKNSHTYISIVECEEVLEAPLGTRVQDGIIQLNVPVQRTENELFQSVPGEIPVQEVPEQLHDRLVFVAWCQLKCKPMDGRNEYELCFVEFDEQKNAPDMEQIREQVLLHPKVDLVEENQPAAAKAVQRCNDFGDFETTNNDTNDQQPQQQPQLCKGKAQPVKKATGSNREPLLNIRKFGQLGNQQQEQSLTNAISVNSIPKEVAKEKQKQQYRGFPGTGANCVPVAAERRLPGLEDKLDATKQQPIEQSTTPTSELDKPISKDFGFEDEVAVPEDLQLEVIKRTQRSQCRLELGEQGTNVVRIHGPDPLSVKECVKRLKEARNQLLQERKEKENCSPPVQDVQPASNAAFDDAVQQRRNSRAESIQSGQQDFQDWTKRCSEDVYSVLHHHHVPRPLNSIQPFALSAPDSKRKLSMASSRASTPARASSVQKKIQKTYHQALDVPKKYRGVLIGSGGNMLAELQSRYGIKLNVPSEFSNKQVEITGTDGNSVNACKQEIERMIRRLQTKKANLPVPNWRLIPLLIGKDGNNINRLRTKFPEVQVDVPRQSDLEANGDECVPVITLQGDPDEVDSMRQLLVKQIEELKEKHFILFIPIPTDHPDHDVSSFLKYLRGTDSKRIKQLAGRFPEVKMDLPIAADASPKIRLEGPQEKVYEVETTIKAVFEELRKLRDSKGDHATLPVEEKYFSRFLRSNAQVIREIQEEHPNCGIYLDRDRKRFNLNGKKADIDAARHHIEEILDAMIAITHDYVPVEEEYLPLFFRDSARMIQKIQKEHPNCRIFLDRDSKCFYLEGKRAADVDAAKRRIQDTLVTMNLHDYVPVEEKYFQRFMRNNAQVIREIQEDHPTCGIYLERDRKRFHLEGKRADMDAAKRRIQEILDEMNQITRKMSIPINEQRSLSSHFGEMRDKFSVKCHFQNNQLVMVGNHEAQLDATERALQALRPFVKHLEVPMEYHQQLMAMAGGDIHRLERKFNVCIDEQKLQDGQQHTVQLTVVGPEQMVQRCVAFMQADMPTRKLVKVPQKIRYAFLGSGGQLVQQLRRNHGVQIHFAPALDCSDDVAVVGEAAHVDACIRAILQKVTQFQAEKNSALSSPTTTAARIRAAASMAGSNGIQRTASPATGIQSPRRNSPMPRSGRR